MGTRSNSKLELLYSNSTSVEKAKKTNKTNKKRFNWLWKIWLRLDFPFNKRWGHWKCKLLWEKTLQVAPKIQHNNPYGPKFLPLWWSRNTDNSRGEGQLLQTVTWTFCFLEVFDTRGFLSWHSLFLLSSVISGTWRRDAAAQLYNRKPQRVIKTFQMRLQCTAVKSIY